MVDEFLLVLRTVSVRGLLAQLNSVQCTILTNSVLAIRAPVDHEATIATSRHVVLIRNATAISRKNVLAACTYVLWYQATRATVTMPSISWASFNRPPVVRM